MAENVLQQSSEALVVDSGWSELPYDVIESMFKWLPVESVARFRSVCQSWDDLLSGDYFVTWRKKNFKEHPWLLFKYGSLHYRLNVLTKELKAFPLNRLVLASMGGLLLTTDRLSNELFLDNPLTGTGIQVPWMRNIPVSVIICNPGKEAFVQLPVPTLSKEDGILVGDILWKGSQYHIVAVHRDFIEVYDFSKQSWVMIVQQLPPHIGSIVFFKGLFFLTLRSLGVDGEWGVMVFSIKEDYTCHMLHRFSPLPTWRSLWMDPRLVVCGSALFLIRQESGQLYLWELEYDSNLNRSSNLSWKSIPQMPQEVLGFLNSELYQRTSKNLYVRPYRYKSLAVGNYICFFKEGSGNMVFFNTEDRSWYCFPLGDNLENFTGGVIAYVYEPRPDISLS